jgi:hypothetical protein
MHLSRSINEILVLVSYEYLRLLRKPWRLTTSLLQGSEPGSAEKVSAAKSLHNECYASRAFCSQAGISLWQRCGQPSNNDYRGNGSPFDQEVMFESRRRVVTGDQALRMKAM